MIARAARPPAQTISVVDLFCGIGGLTHGLQAAGKYHRAAGVHLRVAAGFDIDKSCKFAYESNNPSDFVCKGVEDTTQYDLRKYYDGADLTALVGCAPCQPFSQLTSNRKAKAKNSEEKWAALPHFLRLAEATKPDIVSMENVPGLRRQKVYRNFMDSLKKLDYQVWDKVVRCEEYGVPQRRKRLVLMASKHGELKLRPPAFGEGGATVRGALESMRPAAEDSAHIFCKLSPMNEARILKSDPGGRRDKWDKEMFLACHRKHDFPETYGRMAWDKPAPTITAQFCFYSCGRFGHPKESRAITIREGALLQTFPPEYQLIDDTARRPNIGVLARQIGNAVPPKLGRVIGETIVAHIAAIGGAS